ncbi:MAG TPA: carbohydrate kinase family protein [Candidatus Magasanikbacteria bacterium]|nr:carbohydrate kinase family protein [Candidatus Magasanikbacteria bacterium]
MALLISGSLAYDYIMDFPDSFKNHILPDQIHILNVCFVVEKLNKNFGGCAGNIAYTVKLLGGEPIILAPLGSDAREYLEHFQKYNISTKYMPIIENSLTSSAHITTDKDDNQIIAYHNGVADKATDLSVGQVLEPIDLALITPTKKEAMIKHAKECYEKKIPFVFDPSHQLTAFTAQELMMLIGQAKFYIANDYEMKLTQEKTGWDMAELLKHVEVVIITLGEKGSVITTKDQIIEVGVCPALSVEDPTGAGDAYRSGFFTAYVQGHDYKTCGQVGAVCATYAVEHYGTQNHQFSLAEFNSRYEDCFGETVSLSL